jgi:hypothetical protein
MTAAQESAAETHIKNQIAALADGHQGFSGDVPLFGNGGPLSVLELNYVPATISLLTWVDHHCQRQHRILEGHPPGRRHPAGPPRQVPASQQPAAGSCWQG